MAKRRETPDVLGELLGEVPAPGEAPSEKAQEQETAEERAGEPAPSQEEPQEQPTSKTAGRQAGRPARQRARRPVELPPSDDKIKGTYYLSPETLDFLESAWLKLRRLVGQQYRGQVSKSLIVEMALQVTLDDLRVRNEKSDIAEAIRRATQGD